MAFMMKKKKYKFTVDLCLEELTAVPFVSAVVFAKVRLLDGGSFSDISSREEVQEHTVRWGAKFSFVCKMSANASTGVLDPCILRVSVRKELKGGRSFQKLGFCDLNLAEFAGSGQTTRRCLLEGYDTRHRQDNSMLRLNISMNMLSGDVLFKVPSPSSKPVSKPDENPERHRDDYSSGGSLKKRPALFNSELLTSGTATDGVGGGLLEPGDLGIIPAPVQPSVPEPVPEETHESGLGHSRNSSNTSQLSKGSGYSSLNSQSQHSRQSSSGDSGHIRNPSSGSGLSETGSLDRGKAALERRKKAAEEGGSIGGRVEITRVNPDSLIEQLIRASNLDHTEPESSGLQLFIAKDGTTALGGHDVKSQMSTGVFKQVVMEDRRYCRVVVANSTRVTNSTVQNRSAPSSGLNSRLENPVHSRLKKNLKKQYRFGILRQLKPVNEV